MKNIDELKAESAKLAQNEEKSGEGYLIEMKEIPGTPFSAIKREEKNDWFIAWGNTVIIGGLNNYQECYESVYPGNPNYWHIIGIY